MTNFRSHSVLKIARWRSGLFCTVAGLAIVLAGCGGGSGTTSTATQSTAAKTAVQINIGDAPADWMLGFVINISSMTLNGSNGPVTVVSASLPLEMMHLMGTMQPMTMVNAPQGTYTGATVTVSSAAVTYMDPGTKTLVQKSLSGPVTSTVAFPTPITVGKSPMAVGFDLDLANSVTMDSAGNMNLNPKFSVTSGIQGAGNASDPTYGGIRQMMGTVSSVSGSTSFSMNSMQAAQTFTFQTNSSTIFQNTSMSSMGTGMILLVNATMQSDGSMLATNVQSMMSSAGVMGGGTILSVTGQPATSLAIVMQNGAGSGMMASAFGSGVTVNLNGSTTYQIDQDGMDTTGLPFTPIFDASHIYAGQSVMPIGSTAMTSGGMGGGTMGSGMMGAPSAPPHWSSSPADSVEPLPQPSAVERAQALRLRYLPARHSQPSPARRA